MMAVLQSQRITSRCIDFNNGIIGPYNIAEGSLISLALTVATTMDHQNPRLRGTFLTSARFLFVFIGFTLSVLSTLFRFLLPYNPTRGADVIFTRPSPRRTVRAHSESKQRRRNVASMATKSSISSASPGCTSNSPESRNSVFEANAPQPSSPELLSRSGINGRTDYENVDRPDFRNTAQRHLRRSESTPPSPTPWASSGSSSGHTDSLSSAARSSVASSTDGSTSGRITFHLPARRRAPSLESFDASPAPKGTGVSFLQRRKVRKAPSAPSGLSRAAKKSTPPPVPPLPASVEKKKSQLFPPLLHKKKSQPVSGGAMVARRSHASISLNMEGDDDILEDHTSQDVAEQSHLVPKRSQTLRTQPYEAPYFFPTPGSVAADTYLPPRRKPTRSKTLPPDELGRIAEPLPATEQLTRPPSGDFPNISVR